MMVVMQTINGDAKHSCCFSSERANHIISLGLNIYMKYDKKVDRTG